LKPSATINIAAAEAAALILFSKQGKKIGERRGKMA
jgi:hypothetical protein